MRILATIVGVIFSIGILQDSFETVILPRRVSQRFRLSRMFYTSTWMMWSSLARKMRPGNRREYYLSYFGPLSLIFLLVIWAVILVFAFALIQWGTGSTLSAPEKDVTFGSYLYWMLVPAHPPVPRNCCAAITGTNISRNLSNTCKTGKGGVPNCWRATFPIPS